MGCISEPVPSRSDPNMIYPVIPFLFYFLSPTHLVFQVATFDTVSSPNLCVNFLSPGELRVQPLKFTVTVLTTCTDTNVFVQFILFLET